jgi:hypothetical protein
LGQLSPKSERQTVFVELVQRFTVRQVGQLSQPLYPSPAPSFQFLFK